MKFESDAAYPDCLKAGDTMLQKEGKAYESLAVSNIENYLGTVQVPGGLAGPVEVHGEHAQA